MQSISQSGRQFIRLSSNCAMDQGTTCHEIMHALGFYHEHSDRIETTMSQLTGTPLTSKVFY